MISLTNIINVSLLNSPLGLAEINPDTIGLFTTDAPTIAFASGYKLYLNPSDVATDFGSTSETYKQAAAIFSQNPNILTGGGYLVVIPLLTLGAATAGYAIYGTPGTDVTGFKAVTTGAFDVTIDGTPKLLTTLDFHTATTLADVATVITTAIGASGTCTYDATLNGGTGGFKIVSATTGALSAVTALTSPVSGVDISGSGFLNGRAGVPVIIHGVAIGSESIPAALLRVQSLIWFYGCLGTIDLSSTQLTEIAVLMQTMDRLFFYASESFADVAGIFTTLITAGYTHTRTLLYIGDGTSPTARLMAAAYAGRALSTDFSGSNTTQTMNLKSLVGVSPDNTITDSTFAACKLAGVDCYANVGDGGSIYSFGINDFFDNVYNEAWYKFSLEIAGFNFLKQTNSKIAQTEAGVTALKGAYEKVTKQGVTNGFIAPGAWTAPIPFGDPADFVRNISENGYYIYSQPVALQSDSDRQARKAPLIQIAVKLAGAIHSSNLIVYVNK